MKKIALSDTAIYIITNKDKIRFNGMFFSHRNDKISYKNINAKDDYKVLVYGLIMQLV